MTRRKIIFSVLLLILSVEVLYYSGGMNVFDLIITNPGVNITLRHLDIKSGHDAIPLIYVITPTYYRLTQRADLTRLANTLRLVQKLHWIVVEDSIATNAHVYELLNTSTVSFTYLARTSGKKNKLCGKGSKQRNAALDWIMELHNRTLKAVVYFADDDNSYSVDIFIQMRFTKVLSMWPVGLSGGKPYEAPIVKNGKITHFMGWNAKQRKFATDMAGFALNVQLFWKFHPMRFDSNWPCGYLETKFIEICCTLQDVEPLADNCTKVLVWHTKTTSPTINDNVSKLVV